MHSFTKIKAFFLPLLVIALIALIFFLSRIRGSEPSFEADKYLSSAQLMVGNTYTADITIASQITNLASGKLILVRERDSNTPLVVMLPDLLQTNVYPNQRYLADLSVGPNTQLTVVKINKK